MRTTRGIFFLLGAFRSQPTAAKLRLVINATKLAAPAIPPDYVGFSAEWGSALALTSFPAFAALLDHLRVVDGGKGPNLRVGGNSADRSWTDLAGDKNVNESCSAYYAPDVYGCVSHGARPRGTSGSRRQQGDRPLMNRSDAAAAASPRRRRRRHQRDGATILRRARGGRERVAHDRHDHGRPRVGQRPRRRRRGHDRLGPRRRRRDRQRGRPFLRKRHSLAELHA